MSGKLLQAVWAYRGKDLDCTETHILARMAWYASDAGGDIFPAIKTLCEETKLGRTQMYERLKALKEKGFLIAEGASTKQTIKYRLSLARLGIIDEFNDLSSRVRLDDTRPETGHLPVRKPDTPRPETGHNRLSKNYIEKHDHHVDKKIERRKSNKQRKSALSHEEQCEVEKLLGFKGIFDSVALAIVEKHSLGDIRNVIELAQGADVKEPGAYIVKSLYKKEA